MTTPNQPRLVLKGHDEIYLIDLNKVLYFLADDHYAHVYYTTGYHSMVPWGLSKIEDCLQEMGSDASFMMRLSRKYIINVNRLQRVSTVKEAIALLDDIGNVVTLHVSKAALRENLEVLSR